MKICTEPAELGAGDGPSDRQIRSRILNYRSGAAIVTGGATARAVNRVHIVAVMLVAMLSRVQPASAQNSRPPAAPVPQVADPVEPRHLPPDGIEDEQRQNLVTVMLMLLGGVCLVGVALIAGTMIWGAKLRRLARVPERHPTRQDDLWYLKKPSPPSGAGKEEPSS